VHKKKTFVELKNQVSGYPLEWLQRDCQEECMPYKNIDELPDSVSNNLPKHAQEIYMEAYNSAWDRYKDPEDRRGNQSREETARSIAWSAVKRSYEKDEDSGKWKKK
jgi:cation transport regulator